MRLLYITLLMMLFVVMMSGASFSGECLQSDSEMYQDMVNANQAAIEGREYDGGWNPSRCWEGKDSSLNAKLKKISIEIVNEPRSNPSLQLEALRILDEFKVNLSDRMLAINAEKILNHVVSNNLYDWPDALRILDDNFDSFNAFRALYLTPENTRSRRHIIYIISRKPKINDQRWIGFFKEQALVEVDDKTKIDLVVSIRKFSQFSTPQFVEYLEKNHLTGDLFALINEDADIESLEYVFNKFDLLKTPAADLSGNEIREHFKYSTGIFNVLKKNLDKPFPEYLLYRIGEDELRLLRNGILAYYGKNFRSKDLRNYFYGSYAYVQDFCKSGVCGSRNKLKNGFNSNGLTDLDKQNITAILNAEKIVQRSMRLSPWK